MDKEKCNICICSNFSKEHKNSVCEVCYHIENIGNGSNHYFIERKNEPKCCGECDYKIDPVMNIFLDQKPYCNASQYFDKDERNIYFQCIRKNYLMRNTPKWCPLKDKAG